MQGFQPLQQHPGIERRHGRPRLPQQHMDVLLNELFRGEDDPAQAAPLPVDMLGRRIDDAVGAERERALPQRRCKHIVDDEPGARLVRNLRHRRDVDHLKGRIGRAFEEKNLGVRPHGAPPGVEVEPVDEGRFDSEPGKKVLHHPSACAEQGLGGDDMIARPHLAHQRRGDRGHAGCGCARGLRALERGHAALEHGNGRIGKSRIEKAGGRARKALLAFLRAVIKKALGEKERLRGFAELRAQRARLHEARFGVIALIGHGHHGLLKRSGGSSGRLARRHSA